MPLLAWLLLGCIRGRCDELDALADDGDLLAIGDSVLAWNHRYCQSVPDHVALNLGRAVDNRAVNGARARGGDAPIPDQYEAGDWDWVLVDGGANDLNGGCDCDGCETTLDGLVAEDLADGVMVELVDRIVADGARVVLMGYYPVPDGAWYGFDDCTDEIDALDARYAALAESRDGVEFFEPGDVMDPERTPKFYAFDDVHPGADGAAALGAAIAAVISGGG